MLLDDSIADREPETSTAVLCGKERGKRGLGQVFFLFDTDSFILEVHPDQSAAIASFTAYVKVGFRLRVVTVKVPPPFIA